MLQQFIRRTLPRQRLSAEIGRCHASIAATTTEVKSQVMFGPFGSGGSVTGFTAPGWAPMRAGFEANFAKNAELGAQLCIYHGDEVVVDLTGKSPAQAEYCAETLQCIFSSGKNMEAIVLAMLVDRGLVCYDDPVAKHWPEFGQHGKDEITVADVMRHDARIPYFSEPGNPEKSVVVPISALDDNAISIDKRIEDSGLSRGVGVRCYHAATRGWIVAGIVRRVDPKHRSLGQFMREEITEPLGLTFFCGIPEEEQANFKYADMTQPAMLYTLACDVIPALLGAGDPVLAACLKESRNKNNPILRPTVEWLPNPPVPTFNNSATGRKSEIPSAGMYANARSIAKVNACMANGGQLGSVRLLSEEVCADMLAGTTDKQDEGLKWHVPFSQGGLASMGCAKGSTVYPNMHLVSGFYGWGGWGGSLSIWNPSKQISLGYAMNGMAPYILGGPRGTTLFEPLHEILAGL